MALAIKNLPAMRKTWVRPLGWEDPLEEGMETHSSILAWKIPTDRGAWQVEVHEVAKSQTWLNDFHSKYLKVFSGFCSTVDPPPNPLNQL